MVREHTSTIEYAMPESSRGRRVTWTLAIFAVLLPCVGMFVAGFAQVALRLLGKHRALMFVGATFCASAFGGIACGYLGRKYAIRSGVQAARWVALVGLLLGVGAICGEIGLVALVNFMDRHY